MTIEEMCEADWEQVRAIYEEGIEGGQATFETESPTWERWTESHLPFCRLIAREGGVVEGWAALGRVSSRPVYAGVAEVSVYVGAAHRGLGVGRALLDALVAESERNGIWTLQAGIFPENAASIALHRACGFREVGRRERIGKMRGCWRDTMLLERRSKLVGVD
ncbi:MAG TPA: GNAT family N-acetyltransferase [Pyrinomonadaceae bacterium]|nr:GNAT family N-acetyltransferase [Pyrinomonadaceae bacterium]